ncbi:MAG: nuclear transport factor 2 family protein [Pseudomonadota bacterium]
MTTATLDAEGVVQRQVDAYNARDIDAFADLFADDVEVYDFPNTLIVKGKKVFRQRYAERFLHNPDLHAEIHRRFAAGRYVVDFETPRGAQFGDAPAVAIYEVADGLITKVWFIREARI